MLGRRVARVARRNQGFKDASAPGQRGLGSLADGRIVMLALGEGQIVGGLRLSQKRGSTSKPSKADCRVRRYVAPLANDVADPVPGDADGAAEGIGREAERLMYSSARTSPDGCARVT